jgi:hypothetical protein
MTPVKKDTPPIVRYTAGKVLGVVASDMSYTNMKSTITMILGKFLTRLESNKLPAEMQVAETRINYQSRHKCKATDGQRESEHLGRYRHRIRGCAQRLGGEANHRCSQDHPRPS